MSEDPKAGAEVNVENIHIPSSEGVESKTCSGCGKSFKACECKSCSKCGSIFQKYWGTKIVKKRSHCRVCFDAVCVTCHMLVNNTLKMCTRCHIQQKEEELSTQRALSAIDAAQGERPMSDSFPGINVAGASVLSIEQRNEALLSAAKSGNHHVMITLLNAGVDIQHTDESKSTSLYYAALGGYLPCVAMLLERGATPNVVNEAGWTPLHAVAWNGSTDGHVECAELLIEMGADVFCVTSTGESATDLAAGCSSKEELVQLLRAAEVEMAVEYLKERLDNTPGFLSKEPHLKLCLKTVVNHLTESNKKEWTLVGVVTPTSSNTNLSHNTAPLSPLKGHLPEEWESRTKSLDRSMMRVKACENCKRPVLSRNFGSSPSLNATVPKADVEPIVRSTTPNSEENNEVKPVISSKYSLDETMAYKYKEKIQELQDEKQHLEKRCKRLMNSVAAAAEEHENEITSFKQQLEVAKEEREIAIKRCEATYANKLTKVRQEAESAVHLAEERSQQLEKDKQDLIQLHKHYKLTWVPDQIVEICSNHKCRSPFTQTRRRHHCRCCGRVFCNNCTSQKISVPPFGYMDPVRVCNPCFALIDDLFKEGMFME